MSASAEVPHAAHPPAAHQSSRVDPRTLGMFLFIASEVMLFGSFFTAYFFIRVVNHEPWPPPPFHLPVFVAFVNTAILVTSSFTMHWALQSIKRGNRVGMQAGLTLTFLMGLTFLLTQLLEYARIGFTPHDTAFGTVFFSLTGLHGAHVVVGLTILAAMTTRAYRGHFSPEAHEGVEIGGIYWHFVDVMWIIVFTTVYVLQSSVPLNPLRSEAEAYRFVWLTLGYFGLIVAGALINKWLGLAVFIALSAIVLYFYLSRSERWTRVLAPTRSRTPANVRRILVVANETVGGETLRDEIRRHSEGSRADVLVVSPALNTPLKHWVSDDDQARDAAEERLVRSLTRLKEVGVEAHGEIGDGEPLQAIEDALRTFGADEIIISTHPEGRSNWLEKGVVSGARERFAVPITHVVVDLERESEEVR